MRLLTGRVRNGRRPSRREPGSTRCRREGRLEEEWREVDIDAVAEEADRHDRHAKGATRLDQMAVAGEPRDGPLQRGMATRAYAPAGVLLSSRPLTHTCSKWSPRALIPAALMIS